MIAGALFVVLALAALAAAVLAVASRRQGAALAGLAVVLAAVTLAYEASGVALVELAALGGAALVVRAVEGAPGASGDGTRGGAPALAADPDPPGGTRGDARSWRRRLHAAAVAATLAGLAFVLVGTWARQFVWTGREIVPGAGFGELPALAAALAGAPGLLGIGLVIVVAAAACAGPPRHRI